MDPGDVPEGLRPRVSELLQATWYPGGLEEARQRHECPADVAVLITANADLNGEALGHFPNLRFIVATGTAYDYIDLDACRERGIVVSNTPGYTGASVAEHAITLALASNRKVCELDAAVHAGDVHAVPLTKEIEGKTAGIIGLGDIGSRVAKLAGGLGMDVVFVNRSPRRVAGARQVSLDELLAAAHFVFLTLPLTAESHHLLDAKAFARMRPEAHVINVSADELIDPVALGEALSNGRIAGAALDVIGSPEPFLRMPNLIITPTCGWYTEECVQRRAATWIDSVEKYLKGTPQHVVS